MSEVQELENQLAGCKELVELRQAALRLSKNTDFKKLILEYFCRDECARYAQSSADPNLSPEDRANALAIAQSAGHLRRFLSVTMQMGYQAENQLADIEQAIVEASIEEDSEQ